MTRLLKFVPYAALALAMAYAPAQAIALMGMLAIVALVILDRDITE